MSRKSGEDVAQIGPARRLFRRQIRHLPALLLGRGPCSRAAVGAAEGAGTAPSREASGAGEAHAIALAGRVHRSVRADTAADAFADDPARGDDDRTGGRATATDADDGPRAVKT